VKHVYQNIGFKTENLADGQVSIHNKYFFTNLSKYDFSYEISANGKVVQTAKLPSLNIAPSQSKTVSIDINDIAAKPGIEYFVTLFAKTKTGENLLPAGWVIASEQLKLPIEAPKNQFELAKSGKVSFSEGDDIAIEGKGFSVNIDPESGIITSYKSKGKELLLNGFGPRPAFWRAPTDNDYGWRMPRVAQLCKVASEQTPVAEKVTTKQLDNAVQVEVNYNFDSLQSTWKTIYTVMGSGVVKVDNQLVTEGDKVEVFPRIGMKMQMPPEFKHVEYLGRGPWENYCDRNSSTFVDRYKTTVDEMYVPYIRPQENGHLTDVRWLALKKKNGSGLLVVADSLIEFNALNNTVGDFDAGPNKDRNLKHANEISPRDLVELHIDYRMIGVGGDNSWGAWPHEPYLIRPSAKGHQYSFTLVPFTSEKEMEAKANLKY
jgi:beta-galactosidase